MRIAGTLGDSFGMVSDTQHGLPCRADRLCSFVAHVVNDLASTLTQAGLLRNAHELQAHSYVHIPVQEHSWNFTQRFSQEGRSTIRRKRA